MTLSNNPHTVYNGMLSAQRNMFLLSSVAVAMLGLSSSRFSDKPLFKLIMQVFSVIMIMIAVTIGLKSNHDFTYYITKMEPLPDHIPIQSWKAWNVIPIVYAIVLLVTAILLVVTFFVR